MDKLDINYLQVCLKNFDWDKYHLNIETNLAKKDEEYRIARAKSLENLTDQPVFI